MAITTKFFKVELLRVTLKMTPEHISGVIIKFPDGKVFDSRKK